MNGFRPLPWWDGALAREILQRSGEHLLLVGTAIGLALAISLPLGLWISRRPRWAGPVLATASTVQTIPSLAIFGLLLTVPLLGGIGPTPAIVALTLYALLPLLRGLLTGLAQVPPGLKEAGRALGLSGRQVLLHVELPLALPTLMAGIRVATVIGVGVATIAAAIGAGGLGVFIFRGIATVNNGLILAGALPAAAIALAADGGLGLLEKRLARRPARGARPRGRRIPAAGRGPGGARAAGRAGAAAAAGRPRGHGAHRQQELHRAADPGRTAGPADRGGHPPEGAAGLRPGGHGPDPRGGAQRPHRRLRGVHRHRLDHPAEAAATSPGHARSGAAGLRRTPAVCTPNASDSACFRPWASRTASPSWCAGPRPSGWASPASATRLPTPPPGGRASATNSSTGRTATPAWPAATACASPGRPRRWISASPTGRWRRVGST